MRQKSLQYSDLGRTLQRESRERHKQLGWEATKWGHQRVHRLLQAQMHCWGLGIKARWERVQHESELRKKSSLWMKRTKKCDNRKREIYLFMKEKKILQQIMGHWGSTTWTWVKYFIEMKFLWVSSIKAS